MKKQNQTTELTIQKEITPIVEQSLSLVITDINSLKSATSLLSQLNQYNDRITEEKERVTKPLNEALKAERSRWKPLETLYKDAIDSLRAKMSTYQTNLTRATTEAKTAIVSRIAPGKGNLSLDTAIKKIEAITTPEKETATEEGLVQFREKQVLKVTDLAKIREYTKYWILDEQTLLKDLKEGKIVPGAETELIQIPVNYR